MSGALRAELLQAPYCDPVTAREAMQSRAHADSLQALCTGMCTCGTCPSFFLRWRLVPALTRIRPLRGGAATSAAASAGRALDI